MSSWNPQRYVSVNVKHEAVSRCPAKLLVVCLVMLYTSRTEAESGHLWNQTEVIQNGTSSGHLWNQTEVIQNGTSSETEAVRNMTLSEYLWNKTEAIRNKTLSTYFVQGIANGSLNPTAFGGFMIQDAVYCYKIKNSIDISADRAPDGELKEYLRNESAAFDSIYKYLSEKWRIKNPAGINLTESCQSYADYERQIASTEDTIYMLVAMTPCYKLWPWLGKQLQSVNHGVYNEWFNDNFNPYFDGYKMLDAFVDEAETNMSINRSKALEVFTRCMQGEYEFFNSVQHTDLTNASPPVNGNVTSGSVASTLEHGRLSFSFTILVLSVITQISSLYCTDKIPMLPI
ncbi:uncharacterized protein LOC132559716 [Ylistrum balloti]|uniref:uncharacterized protein LOC132559716 n=1 Tax=Ylistrum balloti TaxID=509963 RepID=UPI002905873A|nr:uncharacterized protein LOC132559716 [Ylistrum balloti]XP_060080323.1 uncharacterized protein LOC132559716 [Ylistrum balloti]